MYINKRRHRHQNINSLPYAHRHTHTLSLTNAYTHTLTVEHTKAHSHSRTYTRTHTGTYPDSILYATISCVLIPGSIKFSF